MSHLIPDNPLVLVADGRKAILYRSHGQLSDLSLDEERRLAPKDLLDEERSGSRPEEETARPTNEALTRSSR